MPEKKEDDSDAQAVVDRVSKLMEDSKMGHPADGARKPTGYRVFAGWTAPGQDTPPHKPGEELQADDIKLPDPIGTVKDKNEAGAPIRRLRTREDIVAELVQNGNLRPIYPEPKKGEDTPEDLPAGTNPANAPIANSPGHDAVLLAQGQPVVPPVVNTTPVVRPMTDLTPRTAPDTKPEESK